jgi:hypothetical protein
VAFRIEGAKSVNIGVVFPQIEIGGDPAAIRDYAQAVDAMYPHPRIRPLAATRAITHLCIHPVGMGLQSRDEHVKVLERFRKDVLS